MNRKVRRPRPGALDQLVAEGSAVAPAGDLLGLLEELHLPGPPPGPGTMSVSEALAELRAGER